MEWPGEFYGRHRSPTKYLLKPTGSGVSKKKGSEFIGIVNYSIMGLIQLELGPGEDIPTDQQRISQLYENYFQKAKALMLDKNHDYGEAWRSMRTSSYTDLILMKINRTKQIEDNQGNTLISEGIDANYYDMINYAVFALIRLTVENVNL